MEVEQLLARFKQACAFDGPTVERFSSGGMLSQWGHEHASHGGRSPKVNKVEDLIADHNAPLMFGSQRNGTSSVIEKRRGNFLYADSAWKSHQASNPGVKFAFDCVQDFRAQSLAAFSRLSAAAQDQYQSRASTPGLAQDPLGSIEPMPAPRVYDVGSATLFGLSTARSPLNEHLAESYIEDLTNERVGGLSQYAERLRTMFLQKLFVRDEHAIPREWRNNWAADEQCSIQRPGLCKELDRDMMTTALKIVRQLRAFIKNGQGGGEGLFPPINMCICIYIYIYIYIYDISKCEPLNTQL